MLGGRGDACARSRIRQCREPEMRDRRNRADHGDITLSPSHAIRKRPRDRKKHRNEPTMQSAISEDNESRNDDLRGRRRYVAASPLAFCEVVVDALDRHCASSPSRCPRRERQAAQGHDVRYFVRRARGARRSRPGTAHRGIEVVYDQGRAPSLRGRAGHSGVRSASGRGATYAFCRITPLGRAPGAQRITD